jgi:hypothetical protein
MTLAPCMATISGLFVPSVCLGYQNHHHGIRAAIRISPSDSFQNLELQPLEKNGGNYESLLWKEVSLILERFTFLDIWNPK